MNNTLDIYINKRKVGVLGKSVLDRPLYQFRYLPGVEECNAVSLTMLPSNGRLWEDHALHPIFQQNIPEGPLMENIKRMAKVVRTDDFGVLELMGRFQVGRVKCIASSEDNPDVIQHESVNDFSVSDIMNCSNGEKLFAELTERYALRSGVSGMQPKVLADISLGRTTFKTDKFIIKSWKKDKETPYLAVNEFFSMHAARCANITVPEAYISEDCQVYGVERFDFNDAGDPIGFEELIVLQAKDTELKYTASLETAMETVLKFVSPQNRSAARNEFFKVVVLNNVIRNGDAHLKNFGVTYEDVNDVKISPAYDLVSTAVYVNNESQAMSLNNKISWADYKSLKKFGVSKCNLTPKEIDEIINEVIEGVSQSITDLAEFTKNINQKHLPEFSHSLVEHWESAIDSIKPKRGVQLKSRKTPPSPVKIPLI